MTTATTTTTKGNREIEIRLPDQPAAPPATAQELRKLARRLRRVCDLIDAGQEIALDQAEIDQLTTGLIKVEKLLKARKGPTTAKPKPKMPLDVKADHLTILKWIKERKFATSSHVKKYLLVKDAQDRLRELEQDDYLTAFRYERHKGLLSEKCYWLSAKGANLLINNGIKARSNSRYKQNPPEENDVRFATMELELPYQARLAEWKVIRPQTFNSKNRKGNEQTRQTTAIANALHLREERQIREAAAKGENVTNRINAYNQNKHLTGIPLQLNHHVVYKQDSEALMVFVLCPLKVTGQFLEARFKEYVKLTGRVKVWIVFYSKEHAEVWAKEISKAGFGIATLNSLPELFKDWNDEAIKKRADNGQL